MIEIKNLHVTIDGKEILRGVNIKIEKGVHALMGRNGSGKSTLANVIMGHPKYKVTKGEILLNGENIVEMSPDERSRKGLFLSFQYPKEINGVTIKDFLRSTMKAHKKISEIEFIKKVKKAMKQLHIEEDFLKRYLNVGFSGGEKKRMEILQLVLLNPKIVILDETDSGLDIDALKIVSEGINEFMKEENMKEEKTILIITHYRRILDYMNPKEVFIMENGQIIEKGTKKLVEKLEKEGYAWLS